jgi:hypothetical protein
LATITKIDSKFKTVKKNSRRNYINYLNSKLSLRPNQDEYFGIDLATS